MRQKDVQNPKAAYEKRQVKRQLQPLPALQPEPQQAEPVVERRIGDQPIKKGQTVTKRVTREPAAERIDDSLLAMVPADSLAVLRINNLEKTLGMVDQFAAGVLPIPMGVSMLVRMQLAQILGSPELAGLDMGGDFIIFVKDDSKTDMLFG